MKQAATKVDLSIMMNKELGISVLLGCRLEMPVCYFTLPYCHPQTEAKTLSCTSCHQFALSGKLIFSQ